MQHKVLGGNIAVIDTFSNIFKFLACTQVHTGNSNDQPTSLETKVCGAHERQQQH